ncbi:MAG: S8 family peptidase [Dehalococcoides mccartyi]|uniref:S8 family peptidase n=1 Tax=Dehalococcoides TaxID=61434 RepID=UPI002737A577|nr:S8 family peptidase [Dehalococcoides mccartyi]MDP4280165.1 S8 family peptidase [Dehalococcoides mccartyi]
MVNERLPIKFFAKREVDNLRVEGGGSSDDPLWVYSGDELKRHADSLVDAISDFQGLIRKKEEKDSLVPFVLKAKIRNEVIAKTHRREIRSLFEVRGKSNILGLVEPDELIIKIEKSSEARDISNRMKNAEQNRYGISCLERLHRYEPIVEIGEKDPENYKVKLIDFQDYEQNSSIRNLFERTLGRLNAEVVKTNYTRDVTIYNLKHLSSTKLDALRREEIFEAIFSIEPMPKYFVTLDTTSTEENIKIMYPENNTKYVTIGFLDNGIAPISHLKPWLVKKRWTSYPETSINPSHGTFVAGVSLYGDLCEKNDWVGCKGVKIFDATVFPDTEKEGIEEDELIHNIQEAVQANHNDVKIWNLSISVARPVDPDSFSDFAVALDALQDDYNVLICKSVGNCDHFVSGRPKGRIFQGADSVRSLVVGSIAHKKSNGDLAEVDNPSPFTRIGPGPSFIIKPEVTHYGGNAGINKSGEMKTTGVVSFSADGSVSAGSGTSFSTPRISALAAGIFQEVAEDFDPLLLKGLIIHSATYSKRLILLEKERTKQLGFGKPANVSQIIYNKPSEATLILRDSLPKGEYIDIMDFPMPDCLVQDGYYVGQIVVTLVYDPILAPSQRAEYCQSNLDVKMGTYDSKKNRDTTKQNILNPIGREGAQNILLESIYSKSRMRNNPHEFALKERLLIKYADKYYPVKKYGVDLYDLSETNKIKYLGAEKRWFLFLKGIFRDFIVNNAALNSNELSQEFCLIVTIKDPSGKQPVYNAVTQKLNEYHFWHSNIKIRGEVQFNV